MNMIRATILAAMLFTLVGCVIPFGRSTGPDDDRSARFSNESDANTPPGPSGQVLEENNGDVK